MAHSTVRTRVASCYCDRSDERDTYQYNGHLFIHKKNPLERAITIHLNVPRKDVCLPG